MATFEDNPLGKLKNSDKAKRKNTDASTLPLDDDSRPPPKSGSLEMFIYRFPWWVAILVVSWLLIAFSIAADSTYSNIYRQLEAGVAMTLRVTFIAYGGALMVGLMIGMIRARLPQPQRGASGRVAGILHLIAYNLATLFVEVARGLPILTILLIFAFVIIPEFKNYVSDNYDIQIQFRGSSLETAIIALALVYGAFLSEVFRAGIQSIPKGQIEAARSLGMTNLQTMRFVVLPQAIRNVLPPLGNDFLSMIKDTSLISIYGIREVTQIARVSSGSTFLFMETYLIAAVIYLTLTLLGSRLVKLLETRLEKSSR